jgi:cation diffusion facilitator CzcD-associated flavoprotein CzcO
MANICENLEIPPEFSMEARLYRPAHLADAAARLAALEAAILDDIEVLKYPSVPLPYEHDDAILEVAIIGAGQSGKSLAFGLRRYGCHNVRVFDRAPKGRQGPWRTYARNHLLRTKKDSTGGLEWGIPNLHFQRWCDANFGPDYYPSIKKIPRILWADYLDWYGDLLDLPIAYGSRVTDVAWCDEDDCFVLTTTSGSARARFVIVATGIESAGQARFPQIVTDVLPAPAYAHTMSELAVEDVSGRDIVVVGGGASAFDTANAALAAGARRVDLMLRRPHLPPIHRVCWGSKWNGYHRHYIELPDEMKWAYSLADLDLGVPPPRDTYYEAVRDPRFTLYGSAGIDALAYRDGRIHGIYGGTPLAHDFMICGTGARNSLADQSELASLLPHVRLWRDVYIPNGMSSHPELENSPYLGEALQFTPRTREGSFVRRVYYLCSGVAHLSGFRCNLSGLQFVAPRICHDISRQLFLAHAGEVKRAFDTYAMWE